MSDIKSPSRYTITAALPYTNGPIHIGHLAGVYVPADIYARYLRSIGKDVAFVCGSDEHGVAISMKAKKEGVTPKDIIDKYHAIIKQSFMDFGITFDNYSRTSAPVHHKTASDFFTTLYKKGDFIEETTAQLYDEEAQQFLADRFVIGTCPKCGNEEAYGDQCENCGSSLNATDLINPKSTITGTVPTTKETKHWFLPLDRYEDFLKDWILKGHKDDWKPNVYGQCKSWIDGGLEPRAVTRDLDWGIPVPVEGGEGKVLYVWFDAPIGYISSTKEWAAREGKDWEPYWKDKDTKLVHFIGKDNIVFHCIIFPSMLKAEGSYILPENVPANEFLNLEGNKLSTSKNWAVWLHEYLVDFPEMQDSLRYTLTANAPETKDNDFTWKDFQARNNNELVAILGNFINRVVVLTNKYYDGKIPATGSLTNVDAETLEQLSKYPEIISTSIERYRFREAGQELMNLARLGNKYLADEEPWKVIKVDEERVKTIMNVALQIAAGLAVLSEPFLPFTSNKLKNILNLSSSGTERSQSLNWNDVSNKEALLKPEHQINKGELLFRKIEDAEIQTQLDKLEATKKANENENKQVMPQKDTITFDDFSKLDMRVGTIIEAEKMAKAKKLLVLKVDTGLDVRTIVSGIAESFKPEEIVGKKVTVLVNLAPRALRGVDSEGMILMTENADGKLVFVNPDEDGVGNGLTIN
ncbi:MULTISPECIES: methionine--tRNA ligase [Maribacter]|mgnify:CR=1 FL=1|uniref:Methionine--tRNA ligase n=3 Tax=Maribacter TaxID=252356 RepID=A0ABY0UV71_9FLAO|nr:MULTISPECIES: methionine--tRNA ligase [Maribacter]CAG2534559.1 methionyl-tRNA synthetase [Maribacter dokdonensis]SDT22285.1 methionyl-tRNA synthetase [Maribacter dokdonensis]|tara:strand:- start:5106 stop:7193 length:2088 start_codon:yes stop_codon:yes gene_type:complete